MSLWTIQIKILQKAMKKLFLIPYGIPEHTDLWPCCRLFFSGSDANNTERFYRFTSTSDETEVSWINSYIQKYAVYASGYKIKAKDSLITLSTCSYQQDDGRTVLIAVRTQQ